MFANVYLYSKQNNNLLQRLVIQCDVDVRCNLSVVLNKDSLFCERLQLNSVPVPVPVSHDRQKEKETDWKIARISNVLYMRMQPCKGRWCEGTWYAGLFSTRNHFLLCLLIYSFDWNCWRPQKLRIIWDEVQTITSGFTVRIELLQIWWKCKQNSILFSFIRNQKSWKPVYIRFQCKLSRWTKNIWTFICIQYRFFFEMYSFGKMSRQNLSFSNIYLK